MREVCRGSAIPWAVTACSRQRPRWHISPRAQAEVTVRPFPWLQHVTLIFPRVFDNAFLSMPCFLLFSKLNDGRAPEKPVASCEQQLVFQFVQFEVIRVFSAMCLWLVLSHRHKRQFDAVPQSCVQFSCCVPVVHTLDHLHRH